MSIYSISSFSLVLLLLHFNCRITSFTLVSNHLNRRISLVSSINRSSKIDGNNKNLIVGSSASDISSDIITNDEATIATTTKENDEYYYTSTFPGTICTIQIDNNNISLSRKAWKKRRRSKSPILVPVSIINILQNKENDADHQNAKIIKDIVRNNIMYIVMKYGEGDNRGISIRANKMIQLYERIFFSNISKMNDFVTNEIMGYNSIKDMLVDLFDNNDDAQGSNSVIKLSSTSSNGLLLYIDSMSRLRGRDISSHTAIIQTTLDGYHTGQVLLQSKDKQQHQSISNDKIEHKNIKHKD